MSKLQKRKKNSVRHFLSSYMLVLFLPFFIFTIGILVVYWNLENENKIANQIKMEHSIQLIDKSLSALHSLAGQATSATAVKKIASLEEVETDTILEYKDGIDVLTTILKYQEQGVGFIEAHYVYFNKSDYLFYEETLYQGTIFEKYLDKWGIEKGTWKDRVVSERIVFPQYIRCNGRLHYIMPVNVLNEKNQGMLVFMLDTEELLSYFDYAQEMGEGILYVADAAGNVLFTNDMNYSAEEASILGMEKIQNEYSAYSLMEGDSQSKGWKYYYWITDNVARSRTKNFLLVGILLEIMFIIGSLYISLHQARKMGKPIDRIFELVSTDGTPDFPEHNSTEKLGELVADIVNTNQEMQEEIEESKPQLRKAFFHDLLTMDVSSTAELTYFAESAGININSTEFWVVSIRLFSNNDVYDVDEQTLKDVRGITRSIKKHIEESMEQNVWFYQRNYLSLLLLMDGCSHEQVIKVVEETYQWLLDTFSTESVWGISTKCSNIMNLWKHFEEAETVRKACNEKTPILEYSSETSGNYAYYFPEMAEEKMINYMNAGDTKAIRDILAIIESENLINRKLNRNGFIKLNNKICEMISQNLGEQDSMQYIMKLNNMIVGNEVIKGGQYFSVLEKIFEEICMQSAQIKGQRRNELIDQIKEYIENNYANPNLGLGVISMTFGISEGYVSSLFKKQTKIGFIEYVEKLRMAKAIDLLKENNDKRENIEEIAEKVGYNSVQSFRRAFKRVYGTTPKNYR